MNTRRKRATLLAAALVTVAGLVSGPLAAPALAAPSDCATPDPNPPTASWAQPALGLDRTGPLSQGDGRTVAVLSTGVDANQPQLRGRVEAGRSVAGGGAATTDCAGLGTQVAGVIAAGRSGGGTFTGVAPHARIYPVRVETGLLGSVADAEALARGIQAAVAGKVDVICVPIAVYTDSPALHDAVTVALGAGIPVVAAAGDEGGNGNPTPYPAAYPGVLAVTAVDQSGAVIADAGSGKYVTLGAPGAGVLTTQAGQGRVVVDGTGVAAGLVAGVVALVRNKRPGLNPAGITRLLVGNADPVASAAGDPNLAGLVDPYRALTERLSTQGPRRLPGYHPPPAAPSELAWIRARGRALTLTIVAVAVAVLAALIAYAAPRARRRSWRPVLAVRRRDHGPTEPSPPVLLFPDRVPDRGR